MSPNDADGMANSVHPDQTAPDLGLHCLPRHSCHFLEKFPFQVSKNASHTHSFIAVLPVANLAARFSSFVQSFITYRKCPKYSDIQNICCNHSKI